MSELRMHVLDVGQGASLVLDFGDHRYGIVDCGGTRGGSEAPIVRFFRRAIARNPSTRILFLLISHLDMDHVKAIGGLVDDPEIEQRIEKLYCNQVAYRTLWVAAREAIKPGSGIGVNPNNHGALSALRYLGDLVTHRMDQEPDFHAECKSPESDPTRYPVELHIGSLPADVQCHLWSPSQKLLNMSLDSINRSSAELLRAMLSGKEIEDWNTASIVVTFTFAGRRVLLAGDATRYTWAEVLTRAREKWQGADVVLAWHHGGLLGSEGGVDFDSVVWERVLTRAGKIVCISCGSHNRYGHPHKITVANIHRCGGKIFCTEQKEERLDPSVTHFREDQMTTLLRSISKTPLWVEDEGKCCGDIMVEILLARDTQVSCSNGECDRRMQREGCCEERGGPLIHVSGTSQN